MLDATTGPMYGTNPRGRRRRPAVWRKEPEQRQIDERGERIDARTDRGPAQIGAHPVEGDAAVFGHHGLLPGIEPG